MLEAVTERDSSSISLEVMRHDFCTEASIADFSADATEALTDATAPQESQANFTQDRRANLSQESPAHFNQDGPADYGQNMFANCSQDGLGNLTQDRCANFSQVQIDEPPPI